MNKAISLTISVGIATLTTIIYTDNFGIDPFGKWYVMTGYNFIWVIEGMCLARIYSWGRD